MKRFQDLLEVLHRLHLDPCTCASWPSTVYLAVFLQQFSFPFVFVDPFCMSLLDVEVTFVTDP